MTAGVENSDGISSKEPRAKVPHVTLSCRLAEDEGGGGVISQSCNTSRRIFYRKCAAVFQQLKVKKYGL